MNNGRPPPPHPRPGEHRGRERGHDHHQGHNHQHHGAPPHNQRGGHGDRHQHHPGQGHPASSQQPAPQHHPPPAKYHSYKVLIDPMIHRVSEKEKQTRFDGVTVPGNPHHLSPIPSDPRKKPLPSLWRRMEPLELPVPRMVIDEHYVGDPPKVEVTMDNLNDNINQEFLSNRIGKYGEWELLDIEYHPFSKKHLGLARIVFKQVQAAKDCVTGLHGKSIMGKLVNCYLDPRFLMAKKMFEELTTDKKPSPIPDPEPEIEDPHKDELKNDFNNIGDEYDTYDDNKRWDRNDGWENSENKDRNNHYNDDWRNDERRHSRHRRYDGDDYEYDRDRDRDRGGRHRDRGDRERPSRWDKEDRSERGGQVRYGRGREERGGRKERRSRWDRDTRGSRDGEREERLEREEARDADLDREDRRYGGDRDRQQSEAAVNPDFWAEAAARFAAKSDFPDDSNQFGEDALDAVSEGEGGDEDSRNLDLDTRLKMLMKNKDANMPAFLIPSDSSDEEPAKPPAPVVEDTRPLSRAPSPFLSHEAYLASHRDTLALDNMDKVNSALAGVNMGRADDDKMSLSPLSEGGDLAELPGHSQAAQFPGQPGYWPGYYAGAGGYYAGQGQGEHQHDQWGGQYPHYGWGDTGGYNYNQYSEEQERRDRAKQKYQGKNPLKVIIENVLGIVEAELKQILKKDISKRVCETYAFLLFDNWWTEQETRHKEKQERDLLRLKRSEPVPAIIPDKEKVAELPRIPKPEDLSSLIDKRRANLDNKGAKGGSLGMGFRGTIPKLATIQRKPRSPSPKPESSKSKTEKPKSPKKKDKHKDREKEKEKQHDKEEKTEKTPSSKSIFKEIYSDSESEKVDSSDSSSEVESEASDDSDSDSDSDSDDGSDSKVSSKSVSRSSSQSKSRSRSRSKSESRSESVTKPSSPVSRSASASPAPASPKAAVSPRRSALATKLASDSSTDSADEGPEAALSEQGTPSTPVKVTHVTSSPPHITDHCYASMDHCYAAPPQKSSKLSETDSDHEIIEVEGGGGGDHDYTTPRTPPKAAPVTALAPVRPKVKKVAAVRPSLPVKPVKWKQRDYNEKFQIIYEFLKNGVDPEDIMYLKKSYEMMLNEGLSNPQIGWINDTHWVDHPITNIPDPPAKRRRVETFSRPHKTGSARSEGYYKMDPREKARTKYHFHRSGVDAFNIAKLGTKEQQKPQKAISLSREARSENRRMLNALGEDCFDSNLLQFNTLKFRRKAMRFGKSAIHDWGLFAMEHIGADEMVIEYVGDVIRPVLADTRETRYEKQGIGSSYLFRIDLDYVVDATKCGNLARFINHSCEPNCYAKVIKIDGSSKIVIYSKQPIAIGEEITYDYKFPIEDEKIRCLCGSKACRKYLN